MNYNKLNNNSINQLISSSMNLIKISGIIILFKDIQNNLQFLAIEELEGMSYLIDVISNIFNIFILKKLNYENNNDNNDVIIDVNTIANSDCEFVFLSSEPYPFNHKHLEELQDELPNKKIRIVDGESFSWYGSRMLKSANYFKKLQQYC